MADHPGVGKKADVREPANLRLRRWAAAHAVVGPLSIAITVMASVGGAIGLIVFIQGALAGGSSEAEDPRSKPLVPLVQETEGRFGFRYERPAEWRRSLDPENGDGAIFSDPGDPAVSLVASGILWPDDIDGDRYDDAAEAAGRSYASGFADDGGEIEVSDFFGLVEKGPRPSDPATRIPGWRLVVKKHDSVTDTEMTSLVVFAVRSGADGSGPRQVSLVCRAPTPVFDDHARTCNRIASSLELDPAWRS